MKRVIIAGSRTLPTHDNVDEIHAWLTKAFELLTPDVVLCGDAVGIDQMGDRYAKSFNVPVEHYPADWERWGRRAGFIRNSEMAEKATELWLIWDGSSPGSKMMRELAKARGLTIMEYVVE